MSLNAKKVANTGGKKFPNVENGTYSARLVQLIDLGVQAQPPYKGEDKPPVQMVSLTYELLDEFLLDDDGEEMKDKPRWQSETISFHNLSKDKAKSTNRYLAFDPDEVHEGDWSKLLGAACKVELVNNESKGKVYTNVQSASVMRKKEVDKAPELVNPTKLFSLDDPDMEVFKALPDWIQGKIKDNLDYEGSPLQEKLGGKSTVEETSDKPDEVKENDDW